MARREPPPLGAIDSPAPGQAIEDGVLFLSGWTRFESGPTARVEASLDDAPLGRARLGLGRPDVSAAHPGPDSQVSGFELRAGLDGATTGEFLLSVEATSVTGERHSFEPIPIEVRPRAAAPALPAPRPAGQPGNGAKILAFTNMLGLGGAATYLFDLLVAARRLDLLDPTVVTAIDGPLRVELEERGIPAHVLSSVPLHDADAYLDRIDELEAWASGRGFEAVLVNTASGLALPGADLAERLGLPAIWTIHESFHQALLWEGMAPALREHAGDLLSRASLSIFEAEGTRALYLDTLEGPSEAIPYGLDLGPIEAVRDGFDRGRARDRVGIPRDAELLICVGTVEPRKAQVQLLQAFELIAEAHPHAHLAYVGGDDGPDTAVLKARAEASPRAERVRIVPRTRDVLPWFGMADLLVCASDIESLPRTVLEAMAWETPVLATSIFGLPELIEDGETGWLCEPGDVSLLAEGLDRALSAGAGERARIGAAGRVRAIARHDMDTYARAVAERVSVHVR